MNSARINKIIYDETSIRPLIGNFQNGILQPSKEDKLSCAVYTDENTHMKAVIASESGFYRGEIRRNDDCYNNFVLIRNKKKGTCKLIAVDKVTFDFTLQVNAAEAPKKRFESDLNKSTMSDLVKTFGSKKQRKYREQSEKMQLDVETMKEQFVKVVDEIHIDQADLAPQKPEDTETAYKPPINRNAVREEDIYPLEELIPMLILSELNEEAISILSPENELKVSAELVKKEILKLRKSSSLERELKAQIFLYIEYLINYIKVPAKGIGSKKYQPCEYSQKLSEHIFKQFSIRTSSGKMRPLSMRDKCICYILVLAIIGSNHVLNLEELSKDLKLGVKRLQDLSRVLCLTPHAKDKSVVMLKLPLPAPPTVGSPNRKRKR